mgnify:CR=1 FL=1
MRALEELREMVSGRDVALVGNAQSLFSSPRPIDRHELVARINRGYRLDAAKAAMAGTRMDLLLTSWFPGQVVREMLSACGHVAWMSPSGRDRLRRIDAGQMYFYPLEWHEELQRSLATGSRPSTGCMAIDLLMRLIGPGTVTLYGFDFWQSPTWYTGEARPGPHSPSEEELFVRGHERSGRLRVTA